MANVYGNKITAGNDWRTFISYSVSSTDTTTTLTVSMGFETIGGWVQSGKRVYTLAGTGQTTGSYTESNVKLANSTKHTKISRTWSWARTTSAQTKTITAKTVYTGSNQDGTSTATLTITVPALASYSVSYAANGGSSTPSTQTKWYGSTLTLAGAISRTGYTFAGWKASNGTVYSAGGAYTTNAATTMTAQWTPVTYTVSYNANGGSNAPSSQTKTYGVNLTLTSAVPTRPGWTFRGWGTSASTSTVSYAAGGTYTANAAITLYALWQKTVTLSYSSESGSTNVPASQSATIYSPNTSTTFAVNSSPPSRTNYKFLFWQVGSATYSPSQSITISDSTTLTAVWELDYIVPQFLSTIARRSKQNGNEDDEGAYGYIKFTYTKGNLGGVDQTTTPSAKWRIHTDDDSGTWTTVTNGSLAENTFEAIFGGALDTDSQYDILLILSVSGQTDVTYDQFISTSYLPMDVNVDGTAVAMFEPAPDDEEGFFIGKDLTAHGDVTATGDSFIGGTETVVEDIELILDQTATSGTDYELIQALTNIGWSDLI